MNLIGYAGIMRGRDPYMDTERYRIFLQRLIAARERAGEKNKKVFAGKVRINRTSYLKRETGEYPITVAELYRLGDALHITWVDLLGPSIAADRVVLEINDTLRVLDDSNKQALLKVARGFYADQQKESASTNPQGGESHHETERREPGTDGDFPTVVGERQTHSNQGGSRTPDNGTK